MSATEDIPHSDSTVINGLSEWRRGWRVALASAVGCAFAATNAITLGSFVLPLSDEFGWSRAEITACLFIGALGTIFLTPLLGRALDRFGARRIALVGVPTYAIGIATFGLAGPSLFSWYAIWGVFAFFCMGMSPVIWTMAVASRFDQSRGLALAVVLSGMSLSSAVLPIYSVTLIEAVGWRAAYWILSITIVLIAYPLTWLWFKDARRDAIRSEDPQTPDSVKEIPGLKVVEALKSRRFWQIILSLALVGGSYSAIYVHFQPMLTDSGLTAEKAAILVGLIGPASFSGRIITGFLLDKFPATIVAAIAFSLPIVSCLLLRDYDGSTSSAALAIAFTALAAGAEVDLIAYLASRYFGMKSFGTIYGLIFSGHTIGWAIMPLMAGRSFDATGSYDTILTLMIFMLAISAFLAGTLGRYPVFERRDSAEG